MIKRLLFTLLFIVYIVAVLILIVASYFWWLASGKGMMKVFDWIGEQLKRVA